MNLEYLLLVESSKRDYYNFLAKGKGRPQSAVKSIVVVKKKVFFNLHFLSSDVVLGVLSVVVI